MKNKKTKNRWCYLFFKRAFDIVCSLISILILFIPFIIVAILIKMDSKGPVFFKQNRIGKNKKIFKIYKFRSMSTEAPKDTPTHLLGSGVSYITKVGKFIRKTSIDELPQLINILKGEMSFVGPRPALWNQDDLVLERDKYGANSVKPGLTGLAQISGRDELEIPIKTKFDGEYVCKSGFFYDIWLIILTFVSVFKSDGVKEGGVNAENGK